MTVAGPGFVDQFDLAVLSIQAGDFAAALANLDRARSVCTDELDAARCDDLAGAVLRRLGRTDEALERLSTAANAFSTLGDARLAAASIESRAGVLLDLGDTEAAVIDLRYAFDVHQQFGHDLSAEATAQRLTGLLITLGRDDEAQAVAASVGRNH